MSIELISPVANDTLGIYMSDVQKDAGSRAANSLLVNDGFEWKKYSEIYGGRKK